LHPEIKRIKKKAPERNKRKRAGFMDRKVRNSGIV
jgi:hypothetical protein